MATTASPPLFTASWFGKLPGDIVRVGISRGVPRGIGSGYRRYPPLYPGPWLRSASDEEFIRRYEDEVLGALDARQVLADLRRIGGGAPVALVCFERCGTADSWCHRGLVSRYLERHLGLAVYEHGFCELGYGSCHPMLPSLGSLRGP